MVYYIIPIHTLEIINNIYMHLVSLAFIRIASIDNADKTSFFKQLKLLPISYYIVFFITQYLEQYCIQRKELWWGWYYFGANSLGK